MLIEEERALLEGKNIRGLDENSSIWRTLFIANELNELQSERIISFTITYFVFGLLMKYLKSFNNILGVRI